MWPMNWPIHATTNTAIAEYSSVRMPKLSAIHQSSAPNNTKATRMPTKSLRDRRRYQASAATMASAQTAPGCRKEGTGIVQKKAVTDHTIVGTHSRWIHWLV